MVKGEGYLDLLYFDIAHNARAVDVELFIIGRLFLIGQAPFDAGLCQRRVVFTGTVQKPFVLIRLHVRHMLGVSHHSLGLMEGIPVIRQRRICQKTDPRHHNADKDDREQPVRDPAAAKTFTAAFAPLCGSETGSGEGAGFGCSVLVLVIGRIHS